MINVKHEAASEIIVRHGKLQEVQWLLLTIWRLLPLAAVLYLLPASNTDRTSLPAIYCHFSILLSKHTCSCKSMGKFVT